MTAAAPASSVTSDTDLRPHHVARLRAAAEATGIGPDELAERVCDHVFGQQASAERLAAHPEADALRARLRWYIRSLWDTDHDGRLRTARGRTGPGNASGLTLEAYLGGFVLIDDIIIDTLVHALCDDPVALSLALRAYRRVTTTDLLLHLRGGDGTAAAAAATRR